jgi:hypothetical protein
VTIVHRRQRLLGALKRSKERIDGAVGTEIAKVEVKGRRIELAALALLRTTVLAIERNPLRVRLAFVPASRAVRGITF